MASFTNYLSGKLSSTVGNFTSGMKSTMMSAAPGIVGIAGLGQKVSKGIQGTSGTRLKGSDTQEKQLHQQNITNKQLSQLVSDTKRSYAAQRDAVLAATESLQQIKLLREQGAYEHNQLIETIENNGGTGGDDDSGKRGKKGRGIADTAKAAANTPLGRLAILAGTLGLSVGALDFLQQNLLRRPGYRLKRDMVPGSLLRNESGRVTTTVGGGSRIQQRIQPILTKDDSVRKALEDQSKLLGKTEENTEKSAIVDQNQERREKLQQTRAKPTRAEKILGDAQAKFLKGFEDTTTRIFREGLEKLLPEPGVSARTAAGEMYRGQTLRGMTGLDKAAKKIFGKDYGPLFADLGTAYLEVGASAIAENIFASTFGTDEKGALKSRTVGGQVLGNLAAGKKTRAAESLIYGLTGIPTGAESLANYMGFDSATQGVGFVADVLGAATTEFLRPASFKGAAATYTDPRTGKSYSYGGGFMDILTGKGQGILSPQTQAQKEAKALKAKVTDQPAAQIMHKGQSATAVYVTNTDELSQKSSNIVDAVTGNASSTGGWGGDFPTGKDIVDAVTGNASSTGGWGGDFPTYSGGVTADDVAQSTVETSQTIHELYENADKWGSKNAVQNDSIADQDIATQKEVGAGIMTTFRNVGTSLMGGFNSLISAISGRPAGGGTVVAGSGMGSFASIMGNVIGTAAIAYGADKLTKGIKDPTLRGIAQIGLNVAGQKFILGNLGGAGAGFSLSGAASSLAPGALFSQFGATAGNLLVSAGLPGAGSFVQGLTGAQVLSENPAMYAMGETIAGYLPYADAVIRAFQGDYVAAAGSAATAYAVSAMGYGGPWAAIAAFVVGSLLSKKPMKPTLERAIAIRNNNDPKNIRTIQSRHKDLSDANAGLDALLMVAFNHLKLIEKKTGQTPFTHAGIFMRAGDDLIFKLYLDSEMGILLGQANSDKSKHLKYHINFGNPNKVFKNPGTLASQMVDFINESAKKELGESEYGALAEAAQAIRQKSFGELTSRTIRELDNLNPEVSSFYGDAGVQNQFDALMARQDELRSQGVLGETGFESAEGVDVEMTRDDTGDRYTVRQSVGIVDAGTGQIIPYGSEITYTDQDGRQQTITIGQDGTASGLRNALGRNVRGQKVVAIHNGIPIFDAMNSSSGFDINDYAMHSQKYGLGDLMAPPAFLEERIVSPQDLASDYNAQRYGTTGRTMTTNPINTVVSQQDNSQTVNISSGTVNYGTDELTSNYNTVGAG